MRGDEGSRIYTPTRNGPSVRGPAGPRGPEHVQTPSGVPLRVSLAPAPVEPAVLAPGTIDPTARIHPSARIHESAAIGPNVVIEEDVVVGPGCVIGAGTRLLTRCIIVRNTTLGSGNEVHPYAVLGGDPQDRSYDPQRPGELIIGDRNFIREGVTIGRSNWNGPVTRVGSGCYLMGQCHIGHNVSLGDNVVLANYTGLAGHSRIGSHCVFSGHTATHQFVDVGDGVMFRGGAMVSMHVPPYVVVASGNCIGGLNKVGMARMPGMTSKDRLEVKDAFRAVYRTRRAAPMADVLAELRGKQWGPAASAFVAFCSNAIAMDPPRRRGLCGGKRGGSRLSPGDGVE